MRKLSWIGLAEAPMGVAPRWAVDMVRPGHSDWQATENTVCLHSTEQLAAWDVPRHQCP
jgi:hypothetical protein